MGKNGHIKWVFFDFAGTLAFNDPPRAWHYMRACARRGMFLERRPVWDALNAAWAEVDGPEGLAHPHASASEAAYHDFRIGLERHILDILGVAKHQDEIIAEVLNIQDNHNSYTVYPEVEETLARLRAAGYGVSIVSNFNWGLPDLADGLGIGAHMDSVTTSARVGYRKPHRRIFEAAIDSVAADPAKTLFVGDSYGPDVEGPAALGFEAFLVDRRRSGKHDAPTIAFLSELEEHLDLPKSV